MSTYNTIRIISGLILKIPVSQLIIYVHACILYTLYSIHTMVQRWPVVLSFFNFQMEDFGNFSNSFSPSSSFYSKDQKHVCHLKSNHHIFFRRTPRTSSRWSSTKKVWGTQNFTKKTKWPEVKKSQKLSHRNGKT